MSNIARTFHVLNSLTYGTDNRQQGTAKCSVVPMDQLFLGTGINQMITLVKDNDPKESEEEDEYYLKCYDIRIS